MADTYFTLPLPKSPFQWSVRGARICLWLWRSTLRERLAGGSDHRCRVELGVPDIDEQGKGDGIH